ELARYLISELSAAFSLAYVDAAHPAEEPEGGKKENGSNTGGFGRIHMTDKQAYTQFDNYHRLSVFERRGIFKKEDLVIINGNHFQSQSQVLVIHSGKNMEKKLEKLRD